MKITTKTPTGRFVVDTADRRMVHLINIRDAHLPMMANVLLFRCVWFGSDGWCEPGWTIQISIDDAFIGLVRGFEDLMIGEKDYLVYDAAGGPPLVRGSLLAGIRQPDLTSPVRAADNTQPPESDGTHD